jgi:hypothetical protein
MLYDFEGDIEVADYN